MKGESFNRITVDAAALAANYRYLKELAGDIPLMAMVKGDGYGHGMVYAARAFAGAGCRRFGVAELCEGVELRRAGIEGMILVTTCFGNEDASFFYDFDLTPVISTYAQAALLEAEGAARNNELEVHLKVNTGMGRLGLWPEEVEAFAAGLAEYPHLKIAGVMSHFPEADIPGSPSTAEALMKFNRVATGLKERYGVIRHIANSGALFNHPEAYCDMIRVGIALYGSHPAGLPHDRLVPAMRFSSRIIQVKDFPAGSTISYGRTFITKKPTKIAVIPVGYEDGLNRHLSNGGEVLTGGKRVQICGRICMNICMLDVSDMEVEVGDEVVLLGSQGEECITADEVAKVLDTISYEVMCIYGHVNKHFSSAE